VVITTTLNKIRVHNPCEDGWEKLLKGLGKTKADDEPLPFVQILEINGLDDAFWCLRAEPQYAKEWRLFAVTCARRVEHLNPDPRVKNATDVAERYANGQATDEELTAAWASARAAAEAAARESARAAAWAAAEAAAWASAWSAARSAARDAAWAARGAALDAEREWQKQEFLRIVTGTEARGE
jgi:hypothetical protein